VAGEWWIVDGGTDYRMTMELGDERREYSREQLDESKLPDDPFALFASWVNDARDSGTIDPTAMTLSTVDQDGNPSSRIVLLKKIESGSMLFFTSYGSRKANEIATGSKVAIHFYWPEMERQVRFAGTARMIPETESDRYFQERPYESKIAARVSPQSREVPDRSYLEEAFWAQLKKYKKTDHIPRPSDWGGYAITPVRIEFWQGGKHRLHDRIEYALNGNRWSRVRLAP
jgi:pyridoxamine 5'-phosphate oxidase